MLSKLTCQLAGMHCTSCAINIDFELEDIPGIKEAKTHYGKQRSEIVFYPDKVTHKQIVATITKLGYEVIEIHED